MISQIMLELEAICVIVTFEAVIIFGSYLI